MTDTSATEPTAWALSYCDAGPRLWYYIPTVPEGRRWRGPYDNRMQMDDGIEAELGALVHVIQTVARPGFLDHG